MLCALSMNRTALISALTVAGVSIAMFGLYMKKFELDAEGGSPLEVVMVTSDISLGEPLSTAALGTRSLPEAFVQDRHILAVDRERVVGIRASSYLRANQTLLWSDLATASSARRDLSALLRTGMRALTLKANASSAFGGLLRPGDRVDVLLTANAPGDSRRVTVSLLQSVLVLAVGIDTGGPDQSEAQELRATSQGFDVSIAVTLEQATMITHARDRGPLQLVLRNPGDEVPVEGVPDIRDENLITPAERMVRMPMTMMTDPGITRVEEGGTLRR